MAWFAPVRSGVRRAVLVAVASLATPLAVAETLSPACVTDLAALDRGFVESMAQLQRAGTTAEECAALAGQIEAVGRAVTVQLRCRMPGADLDRLIGTLRASGAQFRDTQARLGCIDIKA